MIELPPPDLSNSTTLHQVLQRRRSRRRFGEGALMKSELAQLLWAAQGMTTEEGLRTSPSGYKTYPLELFIVIDRADGIDPGAYRYYPGWPTGEHGLERVKPPLTIKDLTEATDGQDWLLHAAAVVVFTGSITEMAKRVGSRAIHSLNLEAGHAAQNLLLEAAALDLAAVPMAGFDKDRISFGHEQTLYMIALGRAV